MKRLLIGSLILFSNLARPTLDIEINGQNKPLIGHINEALMWNENHLKNIDFVRYNEDRFTILTEGKPNLSEDDLKDAVSGNYVFAPFYTMEKRGGSDYENIGAVILGTKDSSLRQSLHFDSMKK